MVRIILAAIPLLSLACLNSGCHVHLHIHVGGSREPETVVEITNPDDMTPERIVEVIGDGRDQ